MYSKKQNTIAFLPTSKLACKFYRVKNNKLELSFKKLTSILFIKD